MDSHNDYSAYLRAVQSTTTEALPKNRQQHKPMGEGAKRHYKWYQIFALDSVVVKTQTYLARTEAS